MQTFVATTLKSWDEDIAKALLNRRIAYMDQQIQSVLRLLFVAKKARLRVCCIFAGIHPVWSEYWEESPVGYLPHPFMTRYECVGQFHIQADEAVRRGNLEELDSVLHEATEWISLDDAVAVHRTYEDIVRNMDNAILELPDGTTVTPRRLLELYHE